MTEFWKCDGCGDVIGGHFRMGIKSKSGKAIYVVDCPHCTHSGYKHDEDIEHGYKNAKKRWITPEEELEGLTENEVLRQHGFHDIANMHTETVNPKKERRYFPDEEELRRKKSSKVKSKRKIVKKAVKKCKCK